MVFDLLLIILLLMVFGGLGYGWRSGAVMPGSPLGLILAVLVILLVVSLIMPHLWPFPTVIAPVR